MPKIWRGPDERGHLALSLGQLLDQINAFAPDRDSSWDGSIGDEAHQARKSDHNPDANKIVCALDITHDPAHGVDAQQIADQIRASGDGRWQYVIHNGKIANADIDDGAWRARDEGTDDHTHHVHVSARHPPNLADNTSVWKVHITDKSPTPARQGLLRKGSSGADVKLLQQLLGIGVDGNFGSDTFAAVREFQTKSGLEADGVVGSQTWAKLLSGREPSKLNINIKATVFNDAQLAYGSVPADTIGFSLPASVPAGTLVWVRNRANNLVAIGPVIDKGPWNTDDPYWTSSSRPQAESGTDRQGRKTNKAGIDLYLPAADALGVPYTIGAGGNVASGEAQVDWGFFNPAAEPVPQPPLPEPQDLAAAIAALNAATAGLNALSVAQRDVLARLERLAQAPAKGLSDNSGLPSVEVLRPLTPDDQLHSALPIVSEILAELPVPQAKAAGVALAALSAVLDRARRSRSPTG